LARGMARELNKRGLKTIVFTTCSLSPYDSWWENGHRPGLDYVDGIETLRFATGKDRGPYDSVIKKISHGKTLSERDELDFFEYGINSSDLVEALRDSVNDEYELLALPYFHGLTHSVINAYPNCISLVPCFHNEPQFYWKATGKLLSNAKHIFFNSAEEKQLTIEHFGRQIGRRIVESVVAGIGVEFPENLDQLDEGLPKLPDSYFIYAGRKERGKNVHLLCEWFLDYLKKFDRTARLVFIGGGDESLVPRSEYLVDLGFVSEAQKLRLMRNSKAIINLSENESFSIVIMEGWWCGVPAVVSANCAVTANHVRRAHGGFFVSNREEFAEALKRLEDQETARFRLGANGHEYLTREFSFDAVLSRYLEVFSNGERAKIQ